MLARKGVEPVVVMREGRVWESFFTPEMSRFFQRYYEERGVRFLPETGVQGIRGADRVEGVAVSSGDQIPADLVVAGIGVTPATDLAEAAGLDVDDGILVNEYLETKVQGVYAAGDVARYQDGLFGKRRRVEHWDNAVEQGRHLARTLSGERAAFLHVPYFFSDVFDLSYEFWGDGSDADRVVHRGEVEEGSFSTWWLREGRVIAAFVLNRPDEERERAPKWIEERRQAPAVVLEDASRALATID